LSLRSFQIDRAAFAGALLRWYRRSRRDLPWRVDGGQWPDPYHVLLSEIMLQQTQVATVIPYFRRFLKAFPRIEDLAAADEQRVLRLWQGLGYYRRARQLRAAARQIVEHHDGEIPDAVGDLLELPGLGPYTSRAVASIAYGRSVPVVDGNVGRVLARLLLIDKPLDDPAVKRHLWKQAETLVPPKSAADSGPGPAGDFNQAMMELGAMVCTARGPACPQCPVARFCRAHARGRVDQVPVVATRAAQKQVTHRIVALERGRKFLFERRPDSGLWAGMWQMPTVEAAAGSLTADVADRFGLDIERPRLLERFTHLTTHRRIDVRVYRAAVLGGRLRRGKGMWRSLEDLDDLPLANPQRRAVATIDRARRASAAS